MKALNRNFINHLVCNKQLKWLLNDFTCKIWRYFCSAPFSIFFTKRQLQNSSELLIQVWNVKLNIYLSCWIDCNSWHPQKSTTKLFPSHVWLREMPVCKIIRTVKSICAFAEYCEHIFIFLWRVNTWYVFKNLIFFESKNV